jgi:hypothetical protein
MALLKESDAETKLITRQVTLTGLKDIFFDRYAGDNNTKLLWYQKVYLVPNTDILALPATNIQSFLSAHNTNSAPKRLRDARQFKKIANACLSFVTIEGDKTHSDFVPFTRNGKTIHFGEPGEERDEKSGVFLDRRVARLDKGIPNPKERPVLPLPWELSFTLSIFQNKEIKEQEIFNLFTEGGYAIGLGTYRGVFGKFRVTKWE